MGIRQVIGLMLVAVLVALNACTSPVSSPCTPVDDFALSLAKVKQDSISVEVMEYTTGKQATLSKDAPNFTELLKFLSTSTTKQVTSKSATVVENGKTVTVSATIPYAMGIILTFKMRDGSNVEFDCTSDNIWFETDKAIYQASVSPDLRPLLEKVVK